MANHSTGTGQETTDEDAAVLQFPKGIIIELCVNLLLFQSLLSTNIVILNPQMWETAWFRLSLVIILVSSVVYFLIWNIYRSAVPVFRLFCSTRTNFYRLWWMPEQHVFGLFR